MSCAYSIVCLFACMLVFVYCIAIPKANQDLANKLSILRCLSPGFGKQAVYIAMPITRIWQTSCKYCNAYNQDFAKQAVYILRSL